MIENIESVISILPTGIVVVNKDKKIVSMNPYARDVVVGKDAYGKSIISFHKTDYEKGKIEEYFSTLSSNINVELPIVKIFDFHDKPSIFMVRLTKIYDEKMDFNGIVVIFYNLSQITLSRVYDENQKSYTVINKLPVILKNKIVFLNTNEIIFIKSVGSSSLVFDLEGTKYFSNLKISELENKLLHKGFFRSHKSYLVNLSYLREMDCNEKGCKLYLTTDKSFVIPISRRNKVKLNDILSVR